MLPIWAGFAVWVAALIVIGLAVAVSRTRRWLYVRAQLRELDRELALLTREWEAK
jgi:hypothetical protein